ERSSPTSKHASMLALSSVLQTRSRDYKANVPHSKTPRLPATDPSSLLLRSKWRLHKTISTRSIDAGRSCRRNLRLCPLDERDEIDRQFQSLHCHHVYQLIELRSALRVSKQAVLVRLDLCECDHTFPNREDQVLLLADYIVDRHTTIFTRVR